MEILTQLFGRLHPIILHMPIGILSVAFLMEWIGRNEKYASLQPAVGFIIRIGMWSAILAAISGFLLSLEGGYNEAMLWWHKWLGMGTALISMVVYFLHKEKNSRLGEQLFFPIFGILMLFIGTTGHLGGSLTHGSDFLIEPFSNKKKKKTIVFSNMDSVMIFQDLVQPIFKQKCITCHNESKVKGELLMTTIEGFKDGGKTGAFFVAGYPEKSLFLQRANLPLEEKKHMPPKGKKQLSSDEITLLEWWIAEGGHFDKKIHELKKSDKIKTILAKYTESDKRVNDQDTVRFNRKFISDQKIAKQYNITIPDGFDQNNIKPQDIPYFVKAMVVMENGTKNFINNAGKKERFVDYYLGDEEVFKMAEWAAQRDYSEDETYESVKAGYEHYLKNKDLLVHELGD